MLFKPAFHDSDFLKDISHLYHGELHSKWEISEIKKVSKGFHIKFKNVNNIHQAGFFIGEEFALPENQVKGNSSDLLIGKEILNHNDTVFGTVTSISKTPAYFLLEIELLSGETELIPFNEEFFEEKEKRLKLKKRK